MYAISFSKLSSCKSFNKILKSTLIGYRRYSACDRTCKTCPKLFNQRNFSPHLAARNFSWETITASRPVLIVQELLINTHDSLDLSWPTTVLVAVVTIRTCITLPFAIYQNYVFAKYENVMKGLPELAKELKQENALDAKLFRWSERTARIRHLRSLRKEREKRIVKENCHPAKGFVLMLIQLPIWVSVSLSLRNMIAMLPATAENAGEIHSQLSQDGLFWFSNLTVPDPIFVVPVVWGILNLSLIEFHALRQTNKKHIVQKFVTNMSRGAVIIVVPIALGLPAGLTMYWFLSSLYGFGQNLLLLHPKFRRFCRIPVTPSESQTPFKDVKNNFKMKFLRKVS